MTGGNREPITSRSATIDEAKLVGIASMNRSTVRVICYPDGSRDIRRADGDGMRVSKMFLSENPAK